MITSVALDTGTLCRRGFRGNRQGLHRSEARGRSAPIKTHIHFEPVCSGRRAAGVPTPAPRAGLIAPNPEFCVVLCAAFASHASVVPRSWQRTKEASLITEAFNLALIASSDASAPARRRRRRQRSRFHWSGRSASGGSRRSSSTSVRRHWSACRWRRRCSSRCC